MISINIIQDIQTMELDSLETMKNFYDHLAAEYRGKDETKYNKYTAEIHHYIDTVWARRAKA